MAQSALRLIDNLGAAEYGKQVGGQCEGRRQLLGTYQVGSRPRPQQEKGKNEEPCRRAAQSQQAKNRLYHDDDCRVRVVRNPFSDASDTLLGPERAPVLEGS